MGDGRKPLVCSSLYGAVYAVYAVYGAVCRAVYGCAHSCVCVRPPPNVTVAQEGYQIDRSRPARPRTWTASGSGQFPVSPPR